MKFFKWRRGFFSITSWHKLCFNCPQSGKSVWNWKINIYISQTHMYMERNYFINSLCYKSKPLQWCLAKKNQTLQNFKNQFCSWKFESNLRTKSQKVHSCRSSESMTENWRIWRNLSFWPYLPSQLNFKNLSGKYQFYLLWCLLYVEYVDWSDAITIWFII